jgi:hypothetical protein
MEFDATLRRAMGRHSVSFLTGWAVRRAARGLTSWARCLPDFIIIGAQRCGTTSLYNYLADHPRVAPSFMKETHFFDLHYAKGLGWYRAQFPYRRDVVRRRLVVGEATPYYLFYPHASHRTQAVVPQAKLIVLLRNPIDRAYSHYHHEVSMGVETASFEEAIEREEKVVPAETERIRQDDTLRSFGHFHYSYLSRGLYADQLELWSHDFRRDRLLVLRSEDFYQDPAATVTQVLDFLGLPAWRSDHYEKYNLAHYTEMGAATRRKLASFYRPHNERLYAFLGRDLEWGG